MMFKALHLSDGHKHGRREDNVALDAREAFIKKHFPGHIRLRTGDGVDDGTAAQYALWMEDLVPGQDIIVPGNHCFGAVGNFYSRECAARFDEVCKSIGQSGCFCGDNLPVVTRFDDVLVIGLDSNLETTSPWDFACGEIGKKQLDALSTILDSRGFKIVMMHHHPFLHTDPFMELKDAEALATVLYGRCDLLLFGHKHQMGWWKDRWRIPNILAADALFNADYAREIVVEGGKATIQEVKII